MYPQSLCVLLALLIQAITAKLIAVSNNVHVAINPVILPSSSSTPVVLFDSNSLSSLPASNPDGALTTSIAVTTSAGTFTTSSSSSSMTGVILMNIASTSGDGSTSSTTKGPTSMTQSVPAVAIGSTDGEITPFTGNGESVGLSVTTVVMALMGVLGIFVFA